MHHSCNTLVKTLIYFIISVAIGIVSGFIWASGFSFYERVLLIELITGAVILSRLFSGGRLYFTNRHRYPTLYAHYTFIGALGGFVFATLCLTLSLVRTSTFDAILFGISIGFFAMMLTGLILLFHAKLHAFFQDNTCASSREKTLE